MIILAFLLGMTLGMGLVYCTEFHKNKNKN